MKENKDVNGDTHTMWSSKLDFCLWAMVCQLYIKEYPSGE